MQRNMHRIIIFANGELPDLEKARLLLRSDDYIICADGGTRHAVALDIEPQLIIGDMDSAEKRHLQALQRADLLLELFPHDKNETDLELAIQRAIALNPDQILIMGALGGRLDHTLGNIALLSDVLHPSLNIRLDDGVEEVLLCRDQVQIHGASGDLVSLIPWQGSVSGIRTESLKWALDNETLYPDKTRGLSNEMIGEIASVSIASGLLLVVHRRKS